MYKKTHLNLALAAFIGLVSTSILAEVKPAPGQPDKNNPSSAAVAQNQTGAPLLKQGDKSKKAESAYRKWAEEEEERSGHIGYSFFEKDHKKQ